jgi:IS1 family transposase
MFFGLTNSPATFQALMNLIFADLIAKGVVAVYLDGILIYTKTIKEHCKVTHKVLCCLEENNLYLRLAKCKFERTEVEYLGMLIRGNHISMDPAKVQAVTDWPTPWNLKDVKGFLGFANFYRRFIEGFARIARPLNNLTKKNVPWSWGQSQQEAFTKLKARFTSSPVLVM